MMALLSGRVATVRGNKRSGSEERECWGWGCSLAKVAREGPSEQGLEGGRRQVNTGKECPSRGNSQVKAPR